jgi:hypothetical protein
MDDKKINILFIISLIIITIIIIYVSYILFKFSNETEFFTDKKITNVDKKIFDTKQQILKDTRLGNISHSTAIKDLRDIIHIQNNLNKAIVKNNGHITTNQEKNLINNINNYNNGTNLKHKKIDNGTNKSTKIKYLSNLINKQNNVTKNILNKYRNTTTNQKKRLINNINSVNSVNIPPNKLANIHHKKILNVQNKINRIRILINGINNIDTKTQKLTELGKIQIDLNTFTKKNEGHITDKEERDLLDKLKKLGN